MPSTTKWDRKNYFYPDLPKGYQISQFDKPICGEGYLEISDDQGAFEAKRVCLERAHLEEDAGKSMHDESNRGGKSKIDLNRTGTPLLEIVTKPDMRSAAEARAFLSELKLILTYIGVSDCNMQEGSLRCDANVNLHIDIDGETMATPIVEVKNINSFRGAERAIEYEVQRQLANWKKTGDSIDDAPKQTRGWDDPSQTTVLQREKEESADYRYFPDPDLIAYTTTENQIDAIRATLGQLPSQIRELLIGQHQIKAYDAEVMIGQGRGVVDYFLALAEGCGNSKIAANWVGQEVLRYLNETNSSIEQYPVDVSQLTQLLKRVDAKEIDQTRAKEVLDEMIKSGNDVETVIASLGIVSVGSDEVAALAQLLITENESVAQQIKEGNGKAIGALIGKARKQNPNVNPGAVKDEILKILGV